MLPAVEHNNGNGWAFGHNKSWKTHGNNGKGNGWGQFKEQWHHKFQNVSANGNGNAWGHSKEQWHPNFQNVPVQHNNGIGNAFGHQDWMPSAPVMAENAPKLSAPKKFTRMLSDYYSQMPSISKEGKIIGLAVIGLIALAILIKAVSFVRNRGAEVTKNDTSNEDTGITGIIEAAKGQPEVLEVPHSDADAPPPPYTPSSTQPSAPPRNQFYPQLPPS